MIISAEITGSPPWIFSRKNGPKRPKTRGDTIVSSPVSRAGKREIHGWVGGKETEGVGAGRNWRGKERLVFLLSARVWSLRNCRYRSRVDLNNDPYGPCSLIETSDERFHIWSLERRCISVWSSPTVSLSLQSVLQKFYHNFSPQNNGAHVKVIPQLGVCYSNENKLGRH